MLAVDVGDFRFALCGGEESGIERYPAVIAQLGNDDAIRPALAFTTGRLNLFESTSSCAVAIRAPSSS
ncbi:hypothetical protein [Bifidobacterium longum]